MQLASETGSSDDLDTINGLADGHGVLIRAQSGHTITIKHSTGNISTIDGNDLALGSTSDIFVGVRVDAEDTVFEVFRNSAVAGADHGSLTGLTDDDHTQYLKEKASGGAASEVPEHNHSAAGEAGGPLSAANTHGSPSANTHHNEAHKDRHKDGGADQLYSVHQYVFHPDANLDADVATGDQQGSVLVSGPSDETVKRIIVNMEVANGGSAGTVEIEFGDGEDLDSVTWGTQIDSVSLTAGAKGIIVTSGFTNATITAQRLLRMNVDAVGSSTPMQNVTVILEVWRPLQT